MRKLRATLRDTLLLIREFRYPLIAFCTAVMGGGFLYYRLAANSAEPVDSILAAIYLVLSMTFLQSNVAFPHTWYLEVFYFLMPVIGIGIFAQGIADFGVLFFNRRARGKEWEMAVASTFHNHIVLVGLGHLGYRVVSNLIQMNQDVVVIEMNPSADLVYSVQRLGVPVLTDDGTRATTLESAGIMQARSLILCTQNDSLNLQIAVKARSMNPALQVVIRIFDDEFAHALQEQFGFTAFSATGMAAPAFAAAAAGLEMTPPINVEGQSFNLGRITVNSGSSIIGRSVGEIEQEFDLSIVLLRQNGTSDFHPQSICSLAANDLLVVLGGNHTISRLTQASLSTSKVRR
jgi:voltage-gated potassium channel